jgi:hypothetical protein
VPEKWGNSSNILERVFYFGIVEIFRAMRQEFFSQTSLYLLE